MNNNVIVPDEWPIHKKVKFLSVILVSIILILVISI
jgi:hypothetical protein